MFNLHKQCKDKLERRLEAYRSLDKAYCYSKQKCNDVEDKLIALQNAVGKFVGIATAMDILKTTPKIESTFLELCDEFRGSHD